ncbi:MAG TPA: arylamine N-acetyltransferase [Baekduia sp.]|uniref:arylamine N-acetyltransferase family protein n=1 Tax=Baekduia sp. TaxID=2600305 RepID=UPI002D79B0AC|nr:arylamine N-acetyltransferase [Baekduia sp.]HET6505447.1 arylamine N-acetyltransferase [Baekduia sp.]
MIDALLAHLGFEETPRADRDGLFAVHERFLRTVPYDGLTAQLGEHAPLDPPWLVERVLATGRAGYCFEINTVLATLLEGLGFAVERREGIVDEREALAGGAPTNHLVLVVRADGEAFVCDAGWGEGFLAPLPLAAGTYPRGPLSWAVERDGSDGWWIQQHMWGSTPGFRFGDDVVDLAAFAPHHERLATSGDSHFVQTLVVQKPLDDRVVTLRARTLSEKGPRVDDRRVLADADTLAATLRDTFGVRLDAGRVARLWDRACAQHEAFAATRSASSPGSAPPAPEPPASA